jgi:hypothetical protein
MATINTMLYNMTIKILNDKYISENEYDNARKASKKMYIEFMEMMYMLEMNPVSFEVDRSLLQFDFSVFLINRDPKWPNILQFTYQNKLKIKEYENMILAFLENLLDYQGKVANLQYILDEIDRTCNFMGDDLNLENILDRFAHANELLEPPTIIRKAIVASFLSLSEDTILKHIEQAHTSIPSSYLVVKHDEQGNQMALRRGYIACYQERFGPVPIQWTINQPYEPIFSAANLHLRPGTCSTPKLEHYWNTENDSQTISIGVYICLQQKLYLVFKSGDIQVPDEQFQLVQIGDHKIVSLCNSTLSWLAKVCYDSHYPE